MAIRKLHHLVCIYHTAILDDLQQHCVKFSEQVFFFFFKFPKSNIHLNIKTKELYMNQSQPTSQCNNQLSLTSLALLSLFSWILKQPYMSNKQWISRVHMFLHMYCISKHAHKNSTVERRPFRTPQFWLSRTHADVAYIWARALGVKVLRV